MVKKSDDTLNRFDRMLACDGQTDTRTDILQCIVCAMHGIAW